VGIVKLGIAPCQIDLKRAKRSPPLADRAKKVENPADPILSGKEKITKNIQLTAQPPSELPERRYEAAGP
jgi:hypothetical protein